MAKYIKQEMPDLNKTGETRTYYRLAHSGNISTDDLIGKLCSHPGMGVSEGAARHILAALAEETGHQLAEGHSVTLDGIGTFMATLAPRKASAGDKARKEATEHNAATIEVAGVNYRADKLLITRVARLCTLERGEASAVNRSPYTVQERLALALEYLDAPEHPFLKCNDYAALTGLPYSTAAHELSKLASQPSSGIVAQGRGPAKTYMKRKD